MILLIPSADELLPTRLAIRFPFRNAVH